MDLCDMEGETCYLPAETYQFDRDIRLVRRYTNISGELI